jgi:hypothetical protein
MNLSGGAAKANYMFSIGLDKNRSKLVRNESWCISVNSINRFQRLKTWN